MSDTDNDTSTLDSKQESSNSDMNVKGFFTYLVISILVVLLYFSTSSALLYVCKIAQSNILPTDILCAPYTESKPDVEPKKINIFEDPAKKVSSKIEFPYEVNSSNKMIDLFREYKNKHSSHFLVNYFIAIAENLLQFNYSSLNSIADSINSVMSENAIIGTGPILVLALYVVGLIISNFYFIYSWFSNMDWFFKTNSNKTNEGKPTWEEVTMILNPIYWSMGVGFVVLFSILLLLGFGIFIGIPTLLFHNMLFSTLSSVAQMNGEKVGLFAIIHKVILHYKFSVVSALSVCIILLAFSNLGPVLGMCSIFTCTLMYLYMDTFTPETPEQLHDPTTPLTDYKQATRKPCSPPPPKQEGFGTRIFNAIVGNQTGGKGTLTHQLKQLSKNEYTYY